ncbi:MAG: histidinol-phosphate transaminase [Alphaproteobacteria bacterium]
MTEGDGPRPAPGILDITPYKGGDSAFTGGRGAVILASNESPLGPSPKALAALRAAEDLGHYPDGGCNALRAALAERHGLEANRVVCGNGSDELLSLLAQAYLREGDEVVITQHAFLLYDIIARANGASVKVAPDTRLTADVDALLAQVNERTRIVFLANPNNPTGTYVPADEVAHLHAGLPPDTLLVLDSAYAEYVQHKDYDSGAHLVSRHPNVVMTRTFSKAYGLAALRLGWAYCPPAIADVLNRVRGPFNVSSVAQAAGLAALQDTDHLRAAVIHNSEWLAWLRAALTKLGLRITPSAANFLLIHFEDEHMAAAADAHLRKAGLILRRTVNYGLPASLRMTVGEATANRAVAAALRDFMAASRRPARHG